MTSPQKQIQMSPLPDQGYFEALLGKATDERVDPAPQNQKTVIWFSAKWCGPCKKVDGDALMRLFPDVKFYKCDVDENTYTPGYCGVQSIPAFLALKGGKVQGNLQNSSTKAIAEWIIETYAVQAK